MNVLRWPALVCVILSVGCGPKGHKGRPTPVASTPVAPVITPAEATMADAARAEVNGRSAEAVVMFETLVAADPPVRNRAQALMAAARLRLSADPALRDIAKARAHLLAAVAIDPRLSASVSAMDLLALLDQETEDQALQEQQDQRASALRVENRTLRNTIKQLQEELAKRDEALHRATEKLLEKAPRAR